ncbi:MAG TPA: hypothetical protein VFF49_07585 [Thermodesulfobacteriota bacterium]|nr:hypothetical protein [Thermodesulfobacteriota bacterium]
MRIFEEVVKVLSILHLINYPIGIIKLDYFSKFGIDIPMFGGLEPFKVERIEKVIRQDVFRDIEAFAEVDDDVKRIIEWVSSLPDMSGEEVENQKKEFVRNMTKKLGH